MYIVYLFARYVESRDWAMAYKVACLGVTDSDWRMLGVAALQSMKLDIARKSFIRIRDMKYIELLYVHDWPCAYDLVGYCECWCRLQECD